MSLVDLLGYAWAALARHRVRTCLSLLGVAIGVAAVVLLTALGEGARRYVSNQFASIGSNLVILFPGRNETTGGFPGVTGVPNDLTLEDARALERGLPSLRALAPVAMGNETVAYRERRRQVAVVGSTQAFLQVRQVGVARGRFLNEHEAERGTQLAVLGAKVAAELFPGQRAVGEILRIGEWRMRVIGVLESRGMHVGLDVDDLVIVPVRTAMQMFDRTSLFRVVLQARAHADVDTVCPRAIEILSERHGEEDVTCVTQETVVSTLGSILDVLTAALGGIAAVSLAVAGVGIMNLMLVSVTERTAEIGLARAVGAQRRQVLAVFLAEAVLLAGLGGVAGLALGWLLVRALAWFYPAFPAAIPLWAAAAAFANALVVGALFGILPARRATRLDPIVALAGQ